MCRLGHDVPVRTTGVGVTGAGAGPREKPDVPDQSLSAACAGSRRGSDFIVGVGKMVLSGAGREHLQSPGTSQR